MNESKVIDSDSLTDSEKFSQNACLHYSDGEFIKHSLNKETGNDLIFVNPTYIEKPSATRKI